MIRGTANGKNHLRLGMMLGLKNDFILIKQHHYPIGGLEDPRAVKHLSSILFRFFETLYRLSDVFRKHPFYLKKGFRLSSEILFKNFLHQLIS